MLNFFSRFVRRNTARLTSPLHHRRHDHRLKKGKVTEQEKEHARTTWWGTEPRWYPAGMPPTRHNKITPIIDGEHFFGALLQELEHAERYICIASWNLTPYFPLERGTPEALEHSRLMNVLARAAERGVMIRILLWSMARYLRQPTRTEMVELVAYIRNKVPNADVVVLYDHHLKFTHCVHEKLYVIDGRIAFVSGMDMTTLAGDRWDTQTHELRNGPNWHDVGLKLEGDVVDDAEKHFRKRYRAVEAQTRIRKTLFPDPIVEDRSHFSVEAQLVTTITKGIYPFEKEGDYGIQHSYLKAIAHAKKYIYLENQYLWSPYIVDALKDAMERNRGRDFRIVILLPARADSGKLDNDQHVTALRDFDETGEVVHIDALYASGAAAGFMPFRAVPIYLHAKVAIIDDEWFTVGSANLNNRGLIMDVELNVAVKNDALAKQLRLDLWAEHLRVSADSIRDLDPVKVIDTIWHNSAAMNKVIIEQGKMPLQSALHHYETGHMPGTWVVERLEDVLLEH